VEDRFIEMIAQAADKSWLDFRAFGNEDHQASLYRSGEVCNAGSFSCTHCDEVLRLTSTAQIPPCAACGGKEFYRISN
jgi:predicted RNA-binding Zn-ribbon protein involved in translation (DUF1610 family)